MLAENHSNKQYGNLTFIRPTGNRNTNGSILWACQCVCGNVVIRSPAERCGDMVCSNSCPAISLSSRSEITGRFDCEIHGSSKPKLVYTNKTTGHKRYTCVECVNSKGKETTKTQKQACVEYLGGKCVRCGYSECNSALDFHHVNPEQKDFAIASTPRPWKRLKAELDKCILLCCRCHREFHAGLWELEYVTNGRVSE